jgi:hypothetical protein
MCFPLHCPLILPSSVRTPQTPSSTATKGTFRSMDSDGEQVHVGAMETPLGVVPEALLRASDLLTITFDGVAAGDEDGGGGTNPAAAPTGGD